MSNLLVRGGHIVYPWRIIEGDILIENGVVKAVGKSIPRPNGVEVVDAEGMLVLPGVVDIHVHMREPGLEYKDDFTRGTLDALMGGVTTVLEMPNTLPPVDTRERLVEKAKLLEPKAYVDFGLYGVIHDGNIDEFKPMVEAGAIGFKIFLGPTTGDIPAPSTPTLYEAMELSKETGVTLAFHAEEWSLVKYFTEKIKTSGRIDPEAHMDSRPPICEELAIRKLAVIAKHTGARIHIVHMSSCEAVEALRQAINEGVDITGETNPHYLLLDSRDYKKYGTLIKVNPPIREPWHRECLWKAVKNNIITIIASDHAPHSADEKKRDVWSAPGGFPGVATLLPLMIDQALRNNISLMKIPELLSLNPAKRFNLYPMKGCLEPGCHGDIVVIDPNKETVIDKNKLHTKHKLTPFHGWRLKGMIKHVILRGTLVYSEGETIDKPTGKLVKPVKNI
ncbi:allantoinase AllB [Desulfurococcaceae archaeon MEX13E-LK6-19]|nr:allantoinase AllB [Desulfurococcaceae archaeon MEX13E-LK6-19]